MKTQRWASSTGQTGLSALRGLAVVVATAVATANTAQALVILDESTQDTTQASQTVKNSMEEYRIEKARREAEEVRAAEVWRNSAEGQAAQRQLEQYQANQEYARQLKEHEKRMEKQAACERQKATGKVEGIFSACR